MDEQKVIEIVNKILADSRYNVSKVTYHVHNNVDSPAIDASDIQNLPPYHCVATTTTGTTAVNVINRGGAAYNFSITGVFLISNDTTAGNITVSNNSSTVATIAKGVTAGAMVGASSLANATYNLGRPLTVVSSSAGNATVFITFKLT